MTERAWAKDAAVKEYAVTRLAAAVAAAAPTAILDGLVSVLHPVEAVEGSARLEGSIRGAELPSVVDAACESGQAFVVLALALTDAARASVRAVLARVRRHGARTAAGRAVGAAAVCSHFARVQLQVVTVVWHAGIGMRAQA